MLSLALAAPAAAKKKPLPCTPAATARFVQGDRPIITGATTAADALTIAGTTVSIGSACSAAPVKLKAKKGFTLVTAKWRSCTGLRGKVKLRAQLAAPGCNRLVGTLKAKKFTATIAAGLSACGDGVLDPGVEQCDGTGCGEGQDCAPDCTCGTATTTSTTSTTSTSLPCCGAERITMTSGPGTLAVANLAPFPLPAGIVAILDSGPTLVGRPECRHDVVVPPGGFVVPKFDVPFPEGPSGYCSEVTTLGCESGAGEGAGTLWDSGADAGLALTNVTQRGDTSDGVCNVAGQLCDVSVGFGAGSNTFGDVDITYAGSRTLGVRSTFDIRLHTVLWEDSACNPNTTPGCCGTATFDGDDVDELISEFDVTLSPTTDVAMSEFVDKNGDSCRAARETAAPDHDLRSLVGAPLPGPCCIEGQGATLVSAAVAFSGLEPLNDLALQLVLPMTVSDCAAPGAATCTVTTDPCLR
jgi:hypothetical protein